MRSNLVTVLACLGLVAAMPAKREPMDERAVKAVLDGVEARGETVDQLIKRVDPKVYRDEIPDCSNYAVDQGVKLPKDGKDDACTTGNNADHCWTEYYFVESAIEYSGWQNSGAAIDCRTTSSCNSDSAIASQTCTAHTKTWSNGVDWQIVEAKLEKVVPDTSNKVSLGSNVKYQHSDVQGDTTQICTTDRTTNRCTWDDQACHQVWYADRTKRIWGHMSRVCVGKTSETVQQQTKNKNGRWVRGQAEFSIALPVNRIVGCNAKCEDLTYNEPLPNQGIERTTFDISFD
ncbi:hypothetical protein FOPG_16717 [Fusarium oxysporum f. sp. conglutinans race 2 54008]|uniref:Secreted in xylem 13 n=1 Tax=Fusarium oxysporum f. sp. conglutinans race 2 54008 TaxID=1089457 RepID=X0GU29_FUSOX|nr:hypothetical protein FOPG_16717 [Fusarium oxysporum f. sp. conglutinans race 2 54008]KAG6979554.1 hypothetical protein FocnCong_v010357 [Fusarium oxysporum f. sp. conglutinans]KAI8402264.1 hypothetical protein FOFC_17571 [Fusarium oxysporum]